MQVIIQGFRSYRDQTVVDPFSPKHNVIGGWPLTLRPFNKFWFHSTYFFALPFFFSTQWGEMVLEKVTFSTVCHVFIPLRTSVVMFWFSELMNGLYSLFWLFSSSHPVCPQRWVQPLATWAAVGPAPCKGTQSTDTLEIRATFFLFVFL